MNAKEFSAALGNVRNEYVVEAVTYRHMRRNCNENIVKRARHLVKKTKKFVWIKCGGMAACVAAVVVLTFSILPNNLDQQGVTITDNLEDAITDAPNDVITDNSNNVIADNLNDAAQPTTSEIHISMSDIIMNEIGGLISACDYARYNPEIDNKVVWSKENIAAYYGTDLTPAYIPDGLFASPLNDTATVYIGQDGTVVEDTVGLSFYHAYYEDGGPKLTVDVAACCGFSLTVSKIGIINGFYYLLRGDEMKTSDIEGIEVAFGHCSKSYGPYNPETHEPSGYYDMYVVEFVQGGIEYMIVAEQMEAEEVVKVVSSIICGEEVIID